MLWSAKFPLEILFSKLKVIGFANKGAIQVALLFCGNSYLNGLPYGLLYLHTWRYRHYLGLTYHSSMKAIYVMSKIAFSLLKPHSEEHPTSRWSNAIS